VVSSTSHNGFAADDCGWRYALLRRLVVSSFRGMPIEHPSELLDFWYLPPLALFILFAIAFFSERIIRSRESRRP
jgi:hypothetical protein